MAFKRPTGAKLRKRNILRRKVGLLPLKPRGRKRVTFIGTARKPKPKKAGPPSPQKALTMAAKFALKGLKGHFGR